MAGNSLDKVLLKLKRNKSVLKPEHFDINQALEELETRIAKGESSATIFGVEQRENGRGLDSKQRRY